MTIAQSKAVDAVYNQYINVLSNRDKKPTKQALERELTYNGKTYQLRDLVFELLEDGLNIYEKPFDKNPEKLEYHIGLDGDFDIKVNKTVLLYVKHLIKEGYLKDTKIINYEKFMEERTKNFEGWANELGKRKFFFVLTDKKNFEHLPNVFEYLKGYLSNPKEYFKIYTAYNLETKDLDLFEEDDLNKLCDENYIKFKHTLYNLIELYKEHKDLKFEQPETMEFINKVNNVFTNEVYDLADKLAEEKAEIK